MTLPHIRRNFVRDEVRFPYDPDIVESLKAGIPPRSRSWHPYGKFWTVRSEYFDFVYGLLERRFGYVAVDDTAAPPQRPDPIRAVDADYATLHLLPSAPRSVVEAAYRALARDHHPDCLPRREQARAHELMVSINAAVAKVRERGAA